MLSNYSNGRILLLVVGFFTALSYALMIPTIFYRPAMSSNLQLLTDPFLQAPTANSVQVVWFTEFAGAQHLVEYGDRFEQKAIATTRPLSRTREDPQSRVGTQTEDGQIYSQPTKRDIWRHAAEVTDLIANTRLPYRVVSIHENGQTLRSEAFTLTASPTAGTPLKILLTSDHQLMPLTPANLQKVVETVGQVDAVFFAGDLVNVPDRASEWFDDNRGNAFFPGLQGRANYELVKDDRSVRYSGGQIIQHAPLFPTVGNHEVMGVYSTEMSLKEQFDNPRPRPVAEQFYQQVVQTNSSQASASPDVKATWIKDNSFNVDTFNEIFTLPKDIPAGQQYYATTLGDVRLVVLYATNIWRRPQLNPDVRGRYRERDEDLDRPEKWGYGQHIFEPIAKGSDQYNWLVNELNRPEFKQAKYKVVMFHHPLHTLGDNIVPAYTNPVQIIDRFADNTIKSIRYEYPKNADYLIRDIEPLLKQAGVDLVFNGHSHIWNRFVDGKTHFLETSNVGNSYGAYTRSKRRPIPIGFQEDYSAFGDPNGLEPIMPSIAPLSDEAGELQPFVASNDITVFAIFETATGTISSYRFDTRQPDLGVIKFDEFRLTP